jgi:hypothetical protein
MMVPKTPIGSRPGTSRRAIAPAMNPTITSTMMKISMPAKLPRSRGLCFLAAVSAVRVASAIWWMRAPSG